MIVITVDNEVDLKKVIKEKDIVVNSLTLSDMILKLITHNVNLTFNTDGRWSWFLTDRNKEKTINEIRGGLGLDHLSNDECLCRGHDEKIESLARDLLLASISREPITSENYQLKIKSMWHVAREFYEVKP